MTTAIPVDFGTDLSCLDDLTDDMAEISGVEVVAQAVYRRLSTPRGALWNGDEGTNYGYDLRNLLSAGITESDLARMPAQIRDQILRDDRVDTATVSVTQTDPISFAVSIRCTTALGPFEMVLGVMQAAVKINAFAVGGT